MAVPGDDQPLVEVGAMCREDVFAFAKTPQEGERGVEDKRPDQQQAKDGTGARPAGRLRASRAVAGRRTSSRGNALPTSPMKIRAGGQLCSRNPRLPAANSSDRPDDRRGIGQPSQAGPAQSGNHGLRPAMPSLPSMKL